MKPFRCFKRKSDPIKWGSGGTVWQYEGTNAYGDVKLGRPVIDKPTRLTHLIAYYLKQAEFANDWEELL